MGINSIKNLATNTLAADTQFMQAKVVGEGEEKFGFKTWNIKIIYGNDLSGHVQSGARELYTNVRMACCDPTKGDNCEIGDIVIVTFLDKDCNNPIIVTSTTKIINQTVYIESGSGGSSSSGGGSGEDSGGSTDGGGDIDTSTTEDPPAGNGKTQYDGTFINPHPGAVVTSECNPNRKHPVTGKIRPHKGIDICAGRYSPIIAAAGGKISYHPNQGEGWGYYIEIDHGNSILTRYAHCGPKVGARLPSSNTTSVENPTSSDGWNLFTNGATVEQGAVIGYEGNTGLGTGAHLHFEIRGPSFKWSDGSTKDYANPRDFISF